MKRLAGERERRRRVGAAAAEAGGDRNVLLDAGLPARSRLRRDRLERAPDERVPGEPGDAQLGRRLELDPVGEIDPLQDRRDLVVAVVAPGADDERKVDLRGRGRAVHSASARATNSAGSSASARTSGSRPSVRNAASARSRDATPLSASEFGSVLRR